MKIVGIIYRKYLSKYYKKKYIYEKHGRKVENADTWEYIKMGRRLSGDAARTGNLRN